jgi:hypothetical protein
MYSKAPVTAENGQCLPEICPMSYALNYISSICKLVDYSYVQFRWCVRLNRTYEVNGNVHSWPWLACATLMPAHDRRCHGKYVITDLGTRVWMLTKGQRLIRPSWMKHGIL